MEKHVQKSRPLGRTRSTYQGVGLAPSKRVFSLLVVLLLIAAAPYQLLAADRYVKASADGLSAPFDGSSWDHPLIGFAGIKTAYEAGDDVYVAAGLYTSTSSLEKRSGNKIHGGFPANATGTDKSGYNPINNPTTIDGANTYKIFGGTVGVADFTMKGIRFIRSNGGASAGGVYCAAGPATQRVTFTDCVFKDNRSAAGYAGVAYFASVTSDASYIRFYNCVFDGNQSQHHGGALGFSTVYNHGNTNTGAFVIDGCSFVNNRNDGSGDDEGGAIYFTTSHGWTIRNSNFCSNRATLRGGALVFTTSHDNIITGSTFSTNGLLPSGDSNGDGGAIYVTTGQVDISNSTFTENTINNTTSNLGGAIYGTTATIGTPEDGVVPFMGPRPLSRYRVQVFTKTRR
jgi:predicted outer membrane repeat protein